MVRITKEVSSLENKDPFELCGLLSVKEAKIWKRDRKVKNLPERNHE